MNGLRDELRCTYGGVPDQLLEDMPPAVAANIRRQIESAQATVPRDTRAPLVIAKADADLAEQEEDLGETDDYFDGV